MSSVESSPLQHVCPVVSRLADVRPVQSGVTVQFGL